MSGNLSLADLLAVEDFHFGRRPRGLRKWDARLKLALCGLLVAANVLVARVDVSLAVLGTAWLGLFITRAPLRAVAWFVLAPLWATTLVVAGFAAGFGHTPIGQLGPLTFYREGLAQGGAAGLRVLAEMACAAALVLSTPFAQILKALRWFKVPEALVETLGFMYRYLFLLWDENAAMRDAARIRGGFSTKRDGLKTAGTVLGSIFLRAYDRSGRVAQAMRARGGEA